MASFLELSFLLLLLVLFFLFFGFGSNEVDLFLAGLSEELVFGLFTVGFVFVFAFVVPFCACTTFDPSFDFLTTTCELKPANTLLPEDITFSFSFFISFSCIF